MHIARTGLLLSLCLGAFAGCGGTIIEESSGSGTTTATSTTPECDPFNDTDMCNSYSCDEEGNLIVTPEAAGTPCSVGVCDGFGGCLFSACDGAIEMPGPPAVPMQGTASLMTGDFNGDGIADIAYVSGEGPSGPMNGAGVALGNGDGTFTQGLLVPYQAHTVDIDAADLNGDGHLDLVIPGCDTGHVDVFEGHGDGTLSPPLEIEAGPLPCAVEIADFDGDGDPDLAVRNWVGGTVTTVANQGGFAFAPLWTSDAPDSNGDMVAADFNGDGAIDLATADFPYDTVTQLQNTGAGFTMQNQIFVGSGPVMPRAADFNGDGAIDLAVTVAFPNWVEVLENQGNGALMLTSDVDVGVEIFGLAAADIDHNGTIDLVAGERTGSGVRPLINVGGGSFQVGEPLAVGPSLRGIAAADFEGDGRMDLAVAGEQGIGILAYRGSSLAAPAKVPATLGEPSIAVADLDSDGYPDVAVAQRGQGVVSVLTNQKDGSLVEAKMIVVGGTPSAIVAADLEGDGSPDLVVLDSAEGVVRRIPNKGGVFGETQMFALPGHPTEIVAVDMNQDGLLDLVLGAGDDTLLRVVLGDANSWQGSYSTCDVGLSIDHLAVGDMDGDGVQDVAFSNANSNGVGVIFWTSDGACGAGIEIDLGAKANGLTLADLHHDGALDMILAVEDHVVVLRNFATNDLVPPVWHPVPEGGASSIAVADMNVDGRRDMVVTGRLASWLVQTSEGSFGAGPSFMTGANEGVGAPEDLDRDGRPDMIVADADKGGVSALLSRCAP